MFPWLGFRSFNFGTVSATANASTLTLQCDLRVVCQCALLNVTRQQVRY
jgi:hypothetical protein